MDEKIQEHLNRAINEYTTGDHFETLIEAREEYFALTGQVNEDDDDYEARMNSFNDWYILQFVSRRATTTVIKDYLIKNQIDDAICKSFLELNHSLFEYSGSTIKKEKVLKDILHNKKVHLTREYKMPAIMKNDILIGRVLDYHGTNFLMDGLCIIPREVKSLLTKEAKRVRKLKDPAKELKFLLQIEYCKTKWRRYGHLDPTKIFSFDH